LTHKTPSYDLS